MTITMAVTTNIQPWLLMTTIITGTITVIAITLTLTVTTTCHKVGVKYLVSGDIEVFSSARIRDVIYWSLLSCVV